MLTLILGSLITFSKHPQKTDTITKRASSIAVLSGGRLIKFLPVVDGWLVGGVELATQWRKAGIKVVCVCLYLYLYLYH